MTLDTCQVLKETLRLYPPIPGAIRLVPKGYELSGYVMPEDTQVMVGVDEIKILIYNSCMYMAA